MITLDPTLMIWKVGMIRLYDGNNFYRIKLESLIGQQAPRQILSDVWEDSEDTHIFVWDAIGGSQWRKDRYPEYKAKRKPTPENIFASIDLLKSALSHTAAVQVCVPDYEGDDVIAAVVAESEGSSIAILSNDYDFEQLRTSQVFPGCRSKDDVLPSEVLLYKMLVGDTSDNIKGIPGFGDVAWRNLQRSKFGIGLTKDQYVLMGMKSSCAEWTSSHADVLKAMKAVASFRPIPLDLLQEHMQAGVPDYNKCFGVIEEFMQ